MCTENTEKSYKIQEITNTKDINYKQNSMPIYSLQGSQIRSSSIPAQNVCAQLKYFAHRIHFYPLWSSKKLTSAEQTISVMYLFLHHVIRERNS
jgi:hypothetical protein